jgi:hypothetical protein
VSTAIEELAEPTVSTAIEELAEPTVSTAIEELAEPAALAAIEEPTQPTVLAAVGLLAEPASKPTQPKIRRSVELRSGSRPRPKPRRRWWRLTWRIVKSLLLAAELGTILVLASYAGLIEFLPASPPHMTVASTGHTVVTQASSYCWFTPGHATCVDGSEQTILAQKLPLVALAKGDNLRFTFDFPAPTHCAATAVNATATGAAPASLGALGRASGSSSLASSRLPVTLAPGIYVVTVACNWTPRSTLRWLQGQGSSSYLLAVNVNAER